MKPIQKPARRLLALFTLITICTTTLAWRQNTQQQYREIQTDTIPRQPASAEQKFYDLDAVLSELDKAKAETDYEKIQAELTRIKPELEKQLETAKIQIEKTLQDVSIEKLKAEAEESIVSMNRDAITASIEKVKNIELKKLTEDLRKTESELKKIKPGIEKELEKAKYEIEMAQKKVAAFKTFIDDLEKDGLINKKEDYSIKHKNGKLIINDKIQPREVYNKYYHFLKEYPSLSVQKTEEGLHISSEKDQLIQ